MNVGEEKRKISRVNYTIKGRAKYKDGLFRGEILDFSLNGFLFRSEEVISIDKGEVLTITLYIEDEPEMLISEVKCIVIRCTEKVLGVKFDIIDYDTLMFLKEKLIHLIGNENKINDEFINFLEGN